MIPQDWTPVRREDGEVVGYARPVEDGLVVPTNLLGHDLSEPVDESRAQALLVRLGLTHVDQTFWARLPNPLTPDRLDAAEVDDAWEWRRVVVVEAGPDECTIRPSLPYPEEQTNVAVLAVPVGELVRLDQP